MGIITIVLDDVFKNQHKHILPMMNKHGYTGTLAVVTGLVDQEYNHTDTWKLRAMSWEEIHDFYQYNWEIASHSRLHRSLDNQYRRGPYSKLSDDEIEKEIAGSKRDLQEKGYEPVSFIVPGDITRQNPLSDREMEMIKEYYDIARKYKREYNMKNPFLNPVPASPYEIMATNFFEYDGMINDAEKTLEKLKDSDKWLVLAVHGIDDVIGGSTYITPSTFNKFLDITKKMNIEFIRLCDGKFQV